MGMPGRRCRGLTRPGLPVLAAAGSAVLIAACGSQAATTSGAAQPASAASPAGVPSPGSASGAALCSGQATVTRLMVSRAVALPQNHLRFAFPAAVTVASPGRARAVAAAICGLLPMPRMVMSCPADLGVRYRLSFAADSASFPVVTASAGGCSGVAGAGPVRSAARSPGFWAVLARAMGISAPALRGTSPAAPHTSPLRPGPSPAG
jgi:hypothetical protein